jgi:hypothetical protein
MKIKTAYLLVFSGLILCISLLLYEWFTGKPYNYIAMRIAFLLVIAGNISRFSYFEKPNKTDPN